MSWKCYRERATFGNFQSRNCTYYTHMFMVSVYDNNLSDLIPKTALPYSNTAHYLGIGVNCPRFQLHLLLWTFLLVAALDALLWHYNSSIIWLSPLFPAAGMHWVVLWTLIIGFCGTGIHQHQSYNMHTPTTAHHYKKLVEYNDNFVPKNHFNSNRRPAHVQY